jgi:hypothetical protein
MEEKPKTIIAFLLGMFFGRFGIPILTHIIYLSIILGLLFVKFH